MKRRRNKRAALKFHLPRSYKRNTNRCFQRVAFTCRRKRNGKTAVAETSSNSSDSTVSPAIEAGRVLIPDGSLRLAEFQREVTFISVACMTRRSVASLNASPVWMTRPLNGTRPKFVDRTTVSSRFGFSVHTVGKWIAGVILAATDSDSVQNLE